MSLRPDSRTGLRGVYAITDPDLLPDAGLLIRAIEQALEGGARLIQYRNKSGGKDQRLQEATALQALCERYGVPLLINDDLPLCLASGAAGVHLGQQDSSLVEARRRLGKRAIIGITCHARLDLALAAQRQGASYVAIGRFFPSQTKPHAPPATLEDLQRIRRHVDLPLVAIGGINAENGASLIQAGADMLAVIGHLFSAPDISRRTRRLAGLFHKTPIQKTPLSEDTMTESQNTTRSTALYEQSLRHIPGGVNSPVRAFGGVGGTPRFIRQGEGAYLTDEDDNRYVDYIGAWGPLILGHRHPAVVAALQEQIEKGLAYGTATAAESDMAELLCQRVPSMDLVRLVTSGTEATMSAIRLARGYTGRDHIVKFEGCYHGHVDSLLVKAGSGALTFGEPDSPGVPRAVTEHTLVLPYNDIPALEELFAIKGDELACVIIEPVAGNMNCIPPVPGFLEKLRELCTRHGAVLIFDEVMTGFRVGPGGAQSLYGITPDLTTLGKVIGGGLPIGAFGGRRDIMEKISPAGPVYQAGTLAGNPLAVAAGLATLRETAKADFYPQLNQRTEQLVNGLQERADAAGIPFTTNQVGGMFGCFFTQEERVASFSQVMNCNVERFRRYFHLMLDGGVYLAPSAFEAGFVSAAHGDEEIRLTLDAAEAAFSRLK